MLQYCNGYAVPPEAETGCFKRAVLLQKQAYIQILLTWLCEGYI